MKKENIDEEHECDFNAGSGGCKACFEEGKSQQKKEELEFLKKWVGEISECKDCVLDNEVSWEEMEERIKQLEETK